VAQRHGLGQKLLADAKRLHRFVPHAAGGGRTELSGLRREWKWNREAGRIKAGERGDEPVRHAGEQQERRGEEEEEDEAAAAA